MQLNAHLLIHSQGKVCFVFQNLYLLKSFLPEWDGIRGQTLLEFRLTLLHKTHEYETCRA